MKLPSLPFFKKTLPKEYFLALLLQDEKLRAVVFEENNGIIHTINEGESTLPAPIDDISFEELLTAADKAISNAESTLPSNTQSHKTIFGVKEDWTENLQISKDHLTTLKKLCDELDLEPIGFLVFAEAIAHLLQKEEGAPVSGVLVELGSRHITATLLRAGRIVVSHQMPTEENLPKAVDALLAQFSDVEILPSRIILLDNEKRPRLGQQFTNHSWSKQLPFLHVPQVTPLAEGFVNQAILFGTATQMGFDILGLPEVKVPNETKEPKETEEVVETKKTPLRQDNEGQAKEEDIKEMEETNKTQKTDVQEEQIEQPEQLASEVGSSAESLGFVKDKDVLETSPKKPITFDNLKTPEGETAEEFANETFADIPEEVKEESLKSGLPGLGDSGVKISEGMQKVFGTLRKVPLGSFFAPLKNIFQHSQDGSSSKKFLFLIPIILLLCIGGVVWYIFGVKATATLFINPKNVTAAQRITFSGTDSTDANSDTIGGTIVPITENGNTSTQATGSQDVGDKAKGAVTIYNNDSDTHTITAGSTITSSNGLKFITAKDVTIASASGDIFSGTKPGTQNVDVTASDIGTQYNLPSGTKFAVGSSSVIAAKNDTAFSGGTKKTVTVVSQKDLDKLTSDLTSNLGNKAKQDAQSTAGSGKVILSTFLSTDMSNQKFDHKAGDQTSSVGLSGTITYQALAYTKADVDTVALSIIQKNNQGENISQDTISEDIQNPIVSKDGKSISATLAIKAGLLPVVDTKKVASELSGKPFTRALDTLSDIPQLASVQSVLSPNLFFLPKSFPRISSHITVGVKPNE